MINGENINKYKEINKIYVPEDYIKDSWKYTINNDTITIMTNNNCYNQYSSTYCDCRQYNIKYNIVGDIYQCNTNNTNNVISVNQLTSDINYSERIRNNYVEEYGIMFLVIITAVLLTQLFKKNSRRI